jgi:hypothetical protein
MKNLSPFIKSSVNIGILHSAGVRVGLRATGRSAACSLVLTGGPMNSLPSFFKNALHATALALLVATALTACGGDDQGPTGSAVNNSAASTPTNGG